MGTVVVHSEDTAEHRYTICQDEDSDSYFLVIDGKLYWENDKLYEGSFDDVHDKLLELRAAENLKTL